jgi:aminoglycoside phosphotransferase (APT) family kinase protein
MKPGRRSVRRSGASCARLHAADLAAEFRTSLRVDPLGRGDPAKRIEVTRRRLVDVASYVDIEPLLEIVEASAGTPLPPTAVVHGDLHVRHVLVDDDFGLAGVIDWGDSALGAPAIDLAIVTALPPAARGAFLAAYGVIDGASWRHARLLGVMFGASLLAADPGGLTGAAARRWLERLIED